MWILLLAAVNYFILYFIIKAGTHDALVDFKNELDELKKKEKEREEKEKAQDAAEIDL